MHWTDDRLAALPVARDVRLRGLAPTRIETFCDAAFAFAVTLVVIAGGSIPPTFDALVEALKDIPAFLVSFAAIGSIWLAHRQWSRRYGIEDGWTTMLSLALVFVMLVYVYPLKMVSSAFMAFMTAGWLPTTFTIAGPHDIPGLFVVYGIGLGTMMLILMLLYLRALRASDALGLDEVERCRTREDVVSHAVLAGTAATSSVLAAVLPPAFAVWMGFIYMTLPVTMPLVAMRFARRVDQLKQQRLHA